MKTWEKVYWAVFGFFYVIYLVVALFKKGDIEVTINGKQEFISKSAYVGYLTLGFVIILVPLWLLIRWIVNRGDNREREREIKITFIQFSYANTKMRKMVLGGSLYNMNKFDYLNYYLG